MFNRSLYSIKTLLFLSGKESRSPLSSLSTSLICRFDNNGSIRNYSFQNTNKFVGHRLLNCNKFSDTSVSLCNPSSCCYFKKNWIHHGRTRYSEISKDSSDEKKEEKPPEKLSIFQRFKAMYRDYWYVLVPVHVATSAVWFGSFYYMARTGVDIGAFAEMIHLSDETIEKIRKSGNSIAGHLAISYLMYKIATPLRYTVTLGGTTVSINYLKKWGWIKPMPKKEELRKMFDAKKVQLKKKRDNLRERHEVMKRTFMNKISQKKRIKKTQDYIRKMLQRKKILKRGGKP